MGITYTPPPKDAWSGVIGELTGLSDGSPAGNAGAKVYHTGKNLLRTGSNHNRDHGPIRNPRRVPRRGPLEAASRTLAWLGAIHGLLYGMFTGDVGLGLVYGVSGLVAGFLVLRLLLLAFWVAIAVAAIAMGIGMLTMLLT